MTFNSIFKPKRLLATLAAAFMISAPTTAPAAPLSTSMENWVLESHSAKSPQFLDCIRDLRARNRRADLLMVPILLDEPKLSKEAIRDINQALQAALSRRWDTVKNPAQYRNYIQNVTAQGGARQVTRELLRDLYGSDAVVWTEIIRSYPNIVRVIVNVSIFDQKRLDKKKATLCSSVLGNFFVDLRTNTVLPGKPTQSPSSYEYFDLSGALRAATLKALAQRPKENDAVEPVFRYRARTEFNGQGCGLIPADVERSFNQIYRELQGQSDIAINDIISGQNSWPRTELLRDDGLKQSNKSELRFLLQPANADKPENPFKTTSPFYETELVVSRKTADGREVILETFPIAFPADKVENCTLNIAEFSLNRVVSQIKKTPRFDAKLVTASDPFKVGGTLNITIDTKAHQNGLYLFCWLINDDATANILYPYNTMQAKRAIPAGTYKMTDLFRLPDLPLTEKSNSIMHCFTSEKQMSPRISKRWLSIYRREITTYDKGNWERMTVDEIQDFLNDFREDRAVGEIMTYVTVVDKN